MEIKQSGSGKAPAGWFTGSVRIDPPFQAAVPSRVSAALVTFEPGARTAWHTLRSRPGAATPADQALDIGFHQDFAAPTETEPAQMLRVYYY